MYLPPLLFDDTLGSKYNNITKIILEIHNFLLSTFPGRKEINIKSRIGNQKSKHERKDNANGESESFSLFKKNIVIYFEPCGFVQLIFEIKFGNLAVTMVIFHFAFC